MCAEPTITLVRGNMTAVVDTAAGMTVTSLRYQDLALLSYGAERVRSGATYGIPILFPTPNRTRNNRFTFAGKQVEAVMHGFARKTPFTQVTLRTGQDNQPYAVTGQLDCTAAQDCFAYFPFPCCLSVTIALTDGGIRWEYQLHNLGESDLGYGFALHPFFLRDPDTVIQTNAPYVMEASDALLPTGRLLPAAGTKWDLSHGCRPDQVQLDTVYYHPAPPLCSVADYPSRGIRLTVSGDQQFHHCVIYTPKEQSFFCLEPQTCSTDCFNLRDDGFQEECGLLVVAPGQTGGGACWLEVCDL